MAYGATTDGGGNGSGGLPAVCEPHRRSWGSSGRACAPRCMMRTARCSTLLHMYHSRVAFFSCPALGPPRGRAHGAAQSGFAPSGPPRIPVSMLFCRRVFAGRALITRALLVAPAFSPSYLGQTVKVTSRLTTLRVVLRYGAAPPRLGSNFFGILASTLGLRLCSIFLSFLNRNAQLNFPLKRAVVNAPAGGGGGGDTPGSRTLVALWLYSTSP